MPSPLEFPFVYQTCSILNQAGSLFQADYPHTLSFAPLLWEPLLPHVEAFPIKNCTPQTNKQKINPLPLSFECPVRYIEKLVGGK